MWTCESNFCWSSKNPKRSGKIRKNPRKPWIFQLLILCEPCSGKKSATSLSLRPPREREKTSEWLYIFYLENFGFGVLIGSPNRGYKPIVIPYDLIWKFTFRSSGFANVKQNSISKCLVVQNWIQVNKTIMPIESCSMWGDMAKSALRASLAKYHLVSNACSWNNS